LTLLLTLFLSATRCSAAGEETLPVGSNPAPVVTPHFPDRLHAVVWRNWQLVEPERIALALGTTEEKIVGLAASMGLPPAGKIPPELHRRGYITILRRNWHLLPYDQLLTLLDMSAGQLAFALREDDFLFLKLGNLKPKCEPLHFQEPDAAAQARAAEIKRLVEQVFGDTLAQPGERRFAFVESLSTVAAPPHPRPLSREGRGEIEATPSAKALRPVGESKSRDPMTGDETASGQRAGDQKTGDQKSDDQQSGEHGPENAARIQRGLRLVYSYFGTYGDPLSDPTLDPYPDGLLARLAEVGVNGVWLHVVLRQLAPGGRDFPEFGEGHQQRLENLGRLVQRAKRYGIGVYLYLNEPRAMPVGFFKNRPEMAGVREGDYVAMCTSDPRVRRWLSDATAYVFGHVPDLAGTFVITGSENLTNCASHGHQKDCPRCAGRSEADIIGEVNTTIAEGVHRGNPQARVLVWDWGWNHHGDAPEIIARLPKSVWLMSVSEWSLPITRGGVTTNVGEYSLSAVGPGPRALRHWELAKEAGLKTVAKIQVNNSWEFSPVPYLPVLDLVAEHCEKLNKSHVDGTMLSWSLGGYPSPNMQVAQRFADQPTAGKAAVLDAIALDRYGPGAVADARRAWTEFSKAFREYPFDVSVLYFGPEQVGPANLLFSAPTGYRATMTGFPYDDLNTWRGPYPSAAFAGQFAKLAEGWRTGLHEFQQVVEHAAADKRANAATDLRLAQAAGFHFASVANQARFILARNALRKPGTPVAERQRLRGEMVRILDDEIALARELFTLTQADSRIGFEASNHYFYVPLDLVEKVINCDWLRQELRKQSAGDQ
jgi:hypothetical protein